MTDRELMQQALDALVYHTEQTRPIVNTNRAIEALRKRLTQCDRCGKVNPAEIHTCTPKKQEPGAVDSDKVICPSCCQQFRAIPVNVQKLMLAAGFEPPFTSPPQREWQGLTDEEIEDIYFGSFSISQLRKFSRAIEAKLKEKNT